MDLFDLSGKKALVTGGSRGLGFAMAEGLLEAGAAVCIIASSESVGQAVEELRSAGGPVHGVRADLSQPDEVERAFRESVECLEGLDVLVNNVGITRRSPTEEHPLEDWEAVMRLNVTTTFLMSKLAARIMLEQGAGKIINLGSLYSFIGGPNQIGYTASKGAIRQMTQAMANEWSGRGINVNAIAPGYIATPLNAELRADPEWHRRVMERVPMGRYGTPAELKGAVVFLASAASDYVSGVMLPVDGGFLSR